MKQLQELFALPINLRIAHIQNGIPLYGSDSLNLSFINLIKNTKYGKNISEKIEELINKKIVIPCFSDRGLISYIRKKLSNSNNKFFRTISFSDPIKGRLDGIFGICKFSEKKILILIDNHVTKGTILEASNEIIARTLLHELIHLFAFDKPYKFLKLFHEELNNYYSEYFSIIFVTDDTKPLKGEITENIYKYIFLNGEMDYGPLLVKDIIYNFSKIKKYSILDEKNFNKIVDRYIKIMIFLYRGNHSTEDLREIQFDDIIKPFYSTYYTIWKKFLDKGCVQEAIYPSEVICGYSEIKPDSLKIKQAIKYL